MIKFKPLQVNRATRLILQNLGLLLYVPGIMALLSIFISLSFGEFYAIKPFLLTAIAALIPAHLLYRLCSTNVSKIDLYHTMLVAALGWAFISLIGAIPFLGIAHVLSTFPNPSPTVLAFQNGWNAVFESFSGFTGTGLSMAKNASELPHSLQWWRSFSEWVDGVGIIILVLAITDRNVDEPELYHATGRQQTIKNSITATARDMLSIYSFYTGFSILLLALFGMPLWEAINHGLTGIATGGFSITKNSITDYNPFIKLATILIMIAGAISFPVHYQILRQRGFPAFWQSAQHRLLLLLLGFGTLILLLENWGFTGSFLWLDSLFQWSSALTTCGFQTAKLQGWSLGSKLLLSTAMLVGGAAGSTVGGLKLNRMITLYQGMRSRFHHFFSIPNDSLQYPVKDEPLNKQQATQNFQSAAVLTILWLILLAVGIFILSHLVSSDYTLDDIVFEATSATSNVGLSTGISDPTLHWGGKLTLILLMWIGRLEIIPVLLLTISLINISSKKRQ